MSESNVSSRSDLLLFNYIKLRVCSKENNFSTSHCNTTFPNCKYLLFLAECFINVGDTTEASSCLLEAAAVFPLSPDVLYMVGNLCPVKITDLIMHGE